MDRKKNIFDKIGSLIPGYVGYDEREGRTNCDKILREGLANQLSKVEKTLYNQMNNALKLNEKEKMTELEETRKKVNTFSSKVKFAPHGVTAFFTDSQIKEDELSKIYKLDLDLAESIGYLHDNVNTSPLSEIMELLESSQEILSKRSSYINEFK